MVQYTPAALADIIGGRSDFDSAPILTGAKPLEYAGPGDVTYIVSKEYLPKLKETGASAVIVPEGLEYTGLPVISSSNPEAAFARATGLFYSYPPTIQGISPKADVAHDAVIGQGASIGAFAVVEAGAVLGDRVVLGPHCVVGAGARIGNDTRLFPSVVVYPGVKIGSRVILHSGVVIGSDGFGFARDVDDNGRPVNIKKYHCGTVEICDDVEIGALCAIDRAAAGVTTLESGVKLDNLVQIAHNVRIGESTVIASQSGIAGSSSVGKYCMLGGQVGIRDHVNVGDGVFLAARVAIYKDVSSGSILAGAVPPMPHKQFLRVQTLIKRLPELLDRIRKIERTLEINIKENG